MSVEVMELLRKDEPGATLRDLDDVRILVDVMTDNDETIAAGAEGTVVGIWSGGEAHIVEIPEPMGALATVDADCVARVGRTVP